MKQTVATAAFLAVGAAAQNSTSTKYEYYNTCTTTAPVVTDTNTVTWCPPCEAAGMTSFPGNSLTTYVTTYQQVCPTDAARLEDATYTVTEPCPSTGLARGPSYIPQGFTVSTVSCSACEAGKSQYAQTTPGPALASALATPAAAPAVPTPAAGTAPPANGENPAAAPGSSGAAGPAGAASPANAESPAAAPGYSSAPSAPGAAGAASPANAENAAALPGSASPAENGATAPNAGSPLSNGAAAPYPLPSQAGQVAAASGAPASNGTVPFTGTANIISVGISSFITALATLITGFAFVL